jgi:hypothetical protein
MNGATITDATDQQKVRILNELASLSALARTGPTALESQARNLGPRIGLAWGVVRDVAHAHGWPNPEGMGRAADAIQQRVERGRPVSKVAQPRPMPTPALSPPAITDQQLRIVLTELETMTGDVDDEQAFAGAASEADVPPATVRRIALQHGWPDRDRISRGVESLPPAHTPPSLKVLDGKGPRVEPTDTLQALVDAAGKSKVAATRRLGERLEEIATQLRTRIGDEAKAAREIQRQEKVQREAQAEITRLELELAAARERARNKRTTKKKAPAAAPASSESKAIRKWAADHGIRVGTAGRIPREISEQYRKAVGQ